MQVLPYILRRLGLAVFVLLGLILITFILTHIIGGNPVVALLGKEAYQHPALILEYEEKYHLNSPVYVQFYYYVVNLLQGNLGYSASKGFIPVTTAIEETLPYTLQLAFFAFVFSIALGVVFGVVASWFQGRALDHGIRGFYLSAVSTPPFYIAILLLLFFSFVLHIFPTGGAVNPNVRPPHAVTGIPILDSALELDLPYLASALYHIAMPSLALTLGLFGVVVRVLRSSMLGVLQMDFVRTARAKGLGERTVFFKHALRNAMVSLVTIASLLVTFLVTGTIFVEQIFAYPGMGQYATSALLAEDYPAIIGTTLVFGVIIVTVNIVADILYVIVDPQIRLG